MTQRQNGGEKIRRLAAIMFTDIIGYTRLMQESEAGAYQVRERHRKIFEEHHRSFNGRILQYYGDGTLSIFDSCTVAVKCAIAMQQELQRAPPVPLRIGIHLGEIVLTDTDIYGDGVNVASRVEQLGLAGSVLISQEVRKQIKNQEIDTVSMGRFAMKNVDVPVDIYAVVAPGVHVPRGSELEGKAKRLVTAPFSVSANTKWMRAVIIGLLAIAAGFLIYWTMVGGNAGQEKSELTQHEKISWAYQTGIPKVEALVDNLFTMHNSAGSGPEAWEAYYLLEKIEDIIPNDPKVQALKEQSSMKVSLSSVPTGAQVFARPYSSTDTAYRLMGETPLVDVRIPSGNIVIRIEKKGYEPFEDLIWVNNLFGNDWQYVLEQEQSLPQGMSIVRTQDDGLARWQRLRPLLEFPDTFFIDKYEVSNREYKAFVQANGYHNKKYWKVPILKDGMEISWDEAMADFVDQTGRPGPSTWEAGDYPSGMADHPVGGVSWYEAMAYAEYIGKQLPSIYHLRYVAGAWAIQEIAPRSNLNSQSTVARTETDAQNRRGVYDIFGNVREWCYNRRNDDFRLIFGGSYNDQEYVANNRFNARKAYDRSPTNGFRCIRSLRDNTYDNPLYIDIPRSYRDYYQEKPVSDETFSIYLNQFVYDKGELFAEKIYSREEEHWIKEKVSFKDPSFEEPLMAYLLLPKNIQPPFQTVIYWPGSAATWYNSSEDFLEIGQVDFLVKNGRAVMLPVYTGTYERRHMAMSGCKDQRVCHKANHITIVKEIRKSIDYLETRSDIDLDKLAYYGISWGATQGPLALAVEKRIKLAILAYGGLRSSRTLPEIEVYNYLPRVTIPVILFNGRYDFIFSLKESIRPFFDYLGTPEENKKLMLYDDAHFVPRNELIKESLNFLDEYFGPVEWKSH